MKKPKIFIACDTNKISEIKKIMAQTQSSKLDVGYKFGLQFFYLKKAVNLSLKLKEKKYF